MAHTPKTPQAIHIYFTKYEEASRWILYSSLLCIINHPNIWWFIFTYSIQATKSKYQFSKGAKKITSQDKYS